MVLNVGKSGAAMGLRGLCVSSSGLHGCGLPCSWHSVTDSGNTVMGGAGQMLTKSKVAAQPSSPAAIPPALAIGNATQQGFSQNVQEW